MGGFMNGISDSHQGDSWKGALDAQLSGWRLRARKLTAEIADLQEERSKLEEQIRAAEVLLGRPHIPGMHDEDKPMSVREMVQELMKDGKPRDGADIRAALIAAGIEPAKVSTNTGAFYTALGRLVDKKFLTKSDRGVYRLVEGAEKEEDKGVFG